MMKGSEFGTDVHQYAFTFAAAIIIGLMVIVVISSLVNPTLENTPKARASLTAHKVALYMSSLSSVEAGSVEKNLVEDYVIRIGRHSGMKRLIDMRPLSNYFVQAFIFDENGNVLAESEKVSFVSDLELKCEKGVCMETSKVSFLSMKKEPGGPIVISGLKEAEETGFEDCKEPSERDIEIYVSKYSARYGVEKPLILALMGAESSIAHCQYEHVKHSTDSEGNPVAFGLMQITPSTANLLENKYNVSINVEDPEQNVMAGVLLLKENLIFFDGYDDQEELAVAFYNCGGIDDAVKKYCTGKTNCWEKIKPYLGLDKEFCNNSNETIPHVEAVMRFYECFRGCFESEGVCYRMSTCEGVRKA